MKKVTQIDLTQKGDITFYAKISGNIIPTEYKITYIYNNEVIEHEPSTYQAGLITYLNNLEVKEYNKFVDEQGIASCRIKEYTLKDYCDKRKSTNLTRFEYCPYCGSKIDWKKIKNREVEL